MIVEDSSGAHVFDDGQFIKSFKSRAAAQEALADPVLQSAMKKMRREREEENSQVVAMGGGGSSSGSAGGGPVDMMIRFEDGADEAAVTPTILGNASLETAAGAGTWTVPILAPVIDTFERSVNGFTVGGAGGSDAGSTRSMRSTLSTDQTFARCVLTTTCPRASCGFAFHTPNLDGFNFYTIMAMHGTGGDYAAFHMRDFTQYEASVETLAGVDDANLIQLNHLSWYWVTVLFDRTNSIARCRIYDMDDNMAQVGVENTKAMSGASDFQTLEFGRQDNHGVFSADVTYIDDLVLCLSTGVGATWPLLPS